MADPPLVTRPATRDDGPTLVALINGAYRGDSSGTGWTHEADIVGGVRIDEAGLRVLDRPGSVVLVAERAGAIVGCVHLEREGGDECFLGMLSVRVTEQASGVGRAILAEAERFARDQLGATVMAMHVITARAELIAWYERRGYRRTGQVEPFEARHGVWFLKGPLVFERMEKALR